MKPIVGSRLHPLERLACGLLLSILGGGGCADQAEHEEDERAFFLASNLQSEDAISREAAEEGIVRLGPRAIRALDNARTSNDSEVRLRAERILREIRTPAFDPLTISTAGHCHASRERLFMLIQSKEEWEEIAEALCGEDSLDPLPAPPRPDFSRKHVLVLLGGEKGSGGYGTFVESVSRDATGKGLEVRFRDGVLERNLPRTTQSTYPWSAWELRRVEKAITLSNVENAKDQVGFNLPDAALVTGLEAARLGMLLEKVPHMDPTVRRALMLRLDDLPKEAALRMVFERIAVESDPWVFIPMFRYLGRHRTPATEKKVLEIVPTHPYLGRGASGHFVPYYLYRKHFSKYLAESTSADSTKLFQRHGFVCGDCPSRVLEYFTVLASRKELSAEIATFLVHRYPRILERILGIVAEQGDPALLEICLTGLERQDSDMISLCRRWFNQVSPKPFDFKEDQPSVERGEYLKMMWTWYRENRSILRWNAGLKRFESQVRRPGNP
ncbi:MAG TPA: hypothetical protein VJB14_04625 [Planctomycetota bacterium]|nr:hypothetical protein [Planctomycetota bacterium]